MVFNIVTSIYFWVFLFGSILAGNLWVSRKCMHALFSSENFWQWCLWLFLLHRDFLPSFLEPQIFLFSFMLNLLQSSIIFSSFILMIVPIFYQFILRLSLSSVVVWTAFHLQVHWVCPQQLSLFFWLFFSNYKNTPRRFRETAQESRNMTNKWPNPAEFLATHDLLCNHICLQHL